MGDENTNNNVETDPIEFKSKHILSKISATELKRSEDEEHNPS